MLSEVLRERESQILHKKRRHDLQVAQETKLLKLHAEVSCMRENSTVNGNESTGKREISFKRCRGSEGKSKGKRKLSSTSFETVQL